MANKRMISSNIWRDDFVSVLDYFKRLLWIGMVVTCADDQGRFQDRAGFIAGDVFPGEMIDHKTIQQAIDEFIEQGKLFKYSDGKTQLLQIVNWWSYQSPQWVTTSKYAAPPGWVDRVKMHVKDNKVFMLNWDKPGGFVDDVVPTSLPTSLPTDVPRPIEDGERMVRGGGGGEIGSSDSPSEIQLMLEKITGIPPAGAGDIKAMTDIENMHPLQIDIQAAFDWVIGQGNNVHRYSSLVNPIKVQIAKRVQKPKSNLDQSLEAIRQFVEESNER